MNASSVTKAPRRLDLETAFAHLAAAASQPNGASADPVMAMRAFVDGYGDVEPRRRLLGVKVRKISAGGVDAEWLIPPAARCSARIVLLHGGGWIAGGLESHRPVAAALAQYCQLPVLLVDYRLAPENPFPAGFEDCLVALAWASENGPDGPAATAAIYLVGDSAGGNLSAAVCQHLAAHGGVIPDRLVMMSPVLDGASNPARGQTEDLVVDHAALEGTMSAYLQGAAALDDPRVSPLFAPPDRFVNFPPTLIQVSGSEFLLWDAQEMTGRLIRAGVRVVLSVWPGMPHVWQAFLTLLPEARQALQEIADFLDAPDASSER